MFYNAAHGADPSNVSAQAEGTRAHATATPLIMVDGPDTSGP